MGKSFGFNPSSWFNNVFFRKEGENYVYKLTDPNLGDLVSVFNGGYSESNMMKLVQIMPELMFICNGVAQRVKNGVYKLVADKDGSVVEDDELWNKMVSEGPNWQFKFDEFIWHAVMHRFATGNRYGYSYCRGATMGVKPKHNTIEGIWLIPPHYMAIFMKNPRPSYLTTTTVSEYVDHYHYTGDTMGDILPDFITHDVYMKMGDTTDIVTGKGVSPFKAAEYPLSNLTAVYSARNVIYVKRGPLGAIVSAAKDAGGSVALGPDEKQEVIDDLQTRFGLGKNQSPFAFTAQPLDFKTFGSTIKDLEPFKETEADTAAICGIIGFPTSLMPKSGESKFSNLDIAERNLYENIIFAEAESICKFLTAVGHFKEVGCHVEVSFDRISALQDDALKNAQALSYNTEASIALFNGGFITENELREHVGREAVDGGDDYIQGEDSDEPIVLDDEVDESGKLLRIRLPSKCVDYLINVPEKGMGYHVAHVMLKNGLLLKSRVIVNCTFLKLHKGEAFTEEDIAEIVMPKNKKRAPKIFNNKKHIKKLTNSFNHGTTA
jgi:hypothetical protein